VFLKDLDELGWSSYEPITTVSRNHGEISLAFFNNQFVGIRLVITINFDTKFVKMTLEYRENSYTWSMDHGLTFPTAAEINEYSARLIKEV